jgi:hypothetical protein
MEMEAYSESLGRAKHWPRTLADQFPGRLVAGLGTLNYGCEDRYTGDGAAARGHALGSANRSEVLLPRWPMTPGNLT